MKSKYLGIMGITLAAIITFTAAPGLAGDKQRYRWEGFAMGVGAAVVGHHIISHGHATPAAPVHYGPPAPVYTPPAYCPPDRTHHRPAKVIRHYYHGPKRHKYKHKHRHYRQPVKVIHHHYYGKHGKKHNKRHHYRSRATRKFITTTMEKAGNSTGGSIMTTDGTGSNRRGGVSPAPAVEKYGY